MTEQLSREDILDAIIHEKWQVLIDFLSEEEIKKFRIETDLSEYKWAGDYAEDARYTYPNRDRLISTVLKSLLQQKPTESRIDEKEMEEFLKKWAEDICQSTGFRYLLPTLKRMLEEYEKLKDKRRG